MKKQGFFPLLTVFFLCFLSYFISIILFSWLLVAILFLPIPVQNPPTQTGLVWGSTFIFHE